MARSGLYKSEVKKARDALIAQGRHPSVDAVRIELGNTGSKTTIHKYLKELEEEGGGIDGRRASVSDMIQDLVERLAAQLQNEAQIQVEAMRAEQAEKERQHAAALELSRQETKSLAEQLEGREAALQRETAALGAAREALQQEAITRHTAEQRAADLAERLAENEAHRRSLEEKHQHAREALEHYRQSVREQREQDQRRHELQVQQLQAELRQAQQGLVVKQEEITRLNQEGVHLVSELSHIRQALHKAEEIGRTSARQLESLKSVEQENVSLKSRLTDKDVQLSNVQKELAVAIKTGEGMTSKVRELELASTAALAKVVAQQEIMEELRSYLKNQNSEKK